jgi:hypothetical protein
MAECRILKGKFQLIVLLKGPNKRRTVLGLHVECHKERMIICRYICETVYFESGSGGEMKLWSRCSGRGEIQRSHDFTIG